MTVRALPLRQDSPYFDFTVDLDDATWRFAFRWNEREGAWYFDIADVNEVPQITSRKVVLSWPLLSRFKTRARLPAGDLIAIDSSNQNVAPGLGELGARVVLYYFEAADLAALTG